jgi:hypothetical protein
LIISNLVLNVFIVIYFVSIFFSKNLIFISTLVRIFFIICFSFIFLNKFFYLSHLIFIFLLQLILFEITFEIKFFSQFYPLLIFLSVRFCLCSFNCFFVLFKIIYKINFFNCIILQFFTYQV